MVPFIYVNSSGCMSHDFKCQMCHPFAAEYSQVTMDNCIACAISKIDKGLIAYYWVKKYAWDIETGKKVLVSKTLVEKWKGDPGDPTD